MKDMHTNNNYEVSFEILKNLSEKTGLPIKDDYSSIYDITLDILRQVLCMNNKLDVIKFYNESSTPAELVMTDTKTIGMGTISPTNQYNLYYSKTNEIPYKSWAKWDGSKITLNQGETLYMYGDNPDGVNVNEYANWIIKVDSTDYTNTSKVYMSGNIKSLLSLNYDDIRRIPNFAFQALFSNSPGIYSVEDVLVDADYTGICALNYTFGGNAFMEYAIKTDNFKPGWCDREAISSLYSLSARLKTITDLIHCTRFDVLSTFYSRSVITKIPLGIENIDIDEDWTDTSNRPLGATFNNVKTLENQTFVGPQKTCLECCNNLFLSASGVVEAILPAKVLKPRCYRRMFYNVNTIKKVTLLAEEGFDNGNPLENWLYGVQPGGTLVLKKGITLPAGASGVPAGWNVEYID